jgi:hypothetical protein
MHRPGTMLLRRSTRAAAIGETNETRAGATMIEVGRITMKGAMVDAEIRTEDVDGG